MDKGIKYWLALTRVKWLERAPAMELIKELGSPEAFFKGGSLKGLSTRSLNALKRFDDWGWVEEEIGRVEKFGARVITFDDQEYPPLLREINDPPYMLYARGLKCGWGAAPLIAIVGTRRPSHYGVQMAEGISRDLTYMGAVVVSGLARGCDSAAHRGALAAGGPTAAVLGTGLDVVYPKENAALYEEIVEKGVVLSEFPMGTTPAPYNFPKRNRIISGVSAGVLVVEAPLRSGALMTARLALDYNREVFALPGAATSYKSKGANRLIKDGAALVECADDIASIISLLPTAYSSGVTEQGRPSGAGVVPVGDERAVLEALGDEPLHIDSIVEKTGISVVKTSALLLDMELKGLVDQRPGKCFVRRF
jgi:DNA processing protein